MDELLKQIEAAWLEKGISAINSYTSSVDDPVYGAAFWLLYCDYSMLGVPCFAINDEGHESATEEFQRWAPPEWRQDVHEVTKEMQGLYSELSDLMEGRSDNEWEVLMDKHYKTMCAVSRSLTEQYHSLDIERKNSEFLVCILEERESDEMYQYLLRGSAAIDRISRAKGLSKFLG